MNGSWRLSYGPYDKSGPQTPADLKARNWPQIPATVPGNVELDLLAAGVIENPELGNNINDLRKYEAYQWWYSRTFETPKRAPGERVGIAFEGLDCFGTIWINGQLVGRTDNMLIAHTYDVTDLLTAETGVNTIHVRIDPAVLEGRKYLNGVLVTRKDVGAEAVNVRKAPHMYGWDIMPRLVSAGLWRDVYLNVKKPTHFRQVYWMTNTVDVQQKTAQLLLDWDFDSDLPTIDGLDIEVSLKLGARTVYEKSIPLYSFTSRHKIDLTDVEFWWPRGYGDPVLYEGTVRIVDAKKRALDERTDRIGIRSAELVSTEITTKENPGEFVFKINGEKIFVRGTNWVPLDGLHSRDKSHLQEAIWMIADLNCNMIRCWGGNVYESPEFYDLCDANGVMIWQDFTMGCSAYPQNNEFAEKIRAEAIQVILRLRQHPALVLWSGNNENDSSFGWTFSKPIDPGVDIISREVLPRVVWEFDPIRPYLPSSPYYSPEFFRRGSDLALLPEVHLWGPRGYYKAPFYTDVNAHFVSEIGYHGCPNRASLERMFDPEYVYPWTKEGNWNDEWQTKAVRSHRDSVFTIDRNELMRNQIKALFGECPTDLDQFIFFSQVVQAEAMKYFVEFWRAAKFRRTGIIWWNLRDGWPIISDAVVDYYNSKKLAYYYIRQVQHNACVMISDSADGKHPVTAVNDTRDAKSGSVTVRDADTGKTLLAASFEIPANGKTVVGALPEIQGQAMWLIEYAIGAAKYTNHYLAGKAPFKLADYQRWYQKLKIKRD
ncbi:MAG: glycoside hydrolase family 2 [Candidatus Aminicenantes bacterium RBG_16_63_16]|nr:MAG: glycoside hydrolase family 2 [Candidatus Aminicenantes bacterium RBG_16_63_16]